MPLVATEIKAKFENRIYEGLKRCFGSEVAEGKNYTPEAQKQWPLLADAISDLAIDLVTEIQTNAIVVPGQQVVTAGGPASQAGTTVSPGKIQ